MRIRNILGIALAFLFAGGATAPAMAQEAGERIIIFVPDLAPQDGASSRFGARVADQLRDMIENLHTHQTVTERQIRDASRRYQINRDRLQDCVTAKQLAAQMNWGLVLCGQYTRTGDRQVAVQASFQAATTSDRFDVPDFTASEREHEQAAEVILESFDRFQGALRSRAICFEYVQSENWGSALENCNASLEIAENESTLYQKGYILYEMGRNQESLTVLDELLEANPIHENALKLSGIVSTNIGAGDRARGYFDRYMELNPGDVGVRLNLATEIANEGDYEGALRLAQEGIPDAPDDLNLITYIGHFAANAASRAESQLSEANGSGNGQTQALQGDIQEFYEIAAESYETVFNERGTETEWQILEKLIIAQFKLGRIDEAVALGERATQAQPDQPRVWEAYARALQESDQPMEALDAIERTESLGHTTAGLTQRKAALQLETDQIEPAIETLQEGVEAGQFSSSAAFRTIFAHAYQEKYRQERWSEAYAIFEAAGPLAVEESDRMARDFWRGYIVYQQAQQAGAANNKESAERAKPLFEQALELFEAARGYERVEPSADVPKLIDATHRFIDIQEALIRRGR